MKRSKRVILQIMAVVLLVVGVKLAWVLVTGGTQATIQVVDAVTGEPISDAPVLAIWWEWTFAKKAWWQGASTVMADYWEGTTDKDGRVTIPRFWSGLWQFHPRSMSPTLTVYKPGYVLWNQERIFPDYRKRDDFSRRHQTVRLGRWDNTYESWAQDGFLDYCTAGELSTAREYLSGTRLFLQRYDSGEATRQRTR